MHAWKHTVKSIGKYNVSHLEANLQFFSQLTRPFDFQKVRGFNIMRRFSHNVSMKHCK